MATDNKNTVIVGAGLTGLTLAYYLRKAGKNVTILEKSNHVGGVMTTIEQDGFIFETGPNSGIISSTELVELLDDLKDKIEVEIADPKSKYRWIWKNGKWNALPTGLLTAITTPLFSLKDKFRVLGEPFRKPGNNPDENVADLVVRRLGKSFLNYAIDPFISGIYAGNPKNLITRFALPKLYNLEQNYGSFIKGAIAKKKEPKTELESRVTKEVFSVKGGFKNLVAALCDKIGNENIQLGIENLEITKFEDTYYTSYDSMEGKNNTVRSNSVVTTINGEQLTDILPFVPAEKFKPITALRYAPVVQAVACYRDWDGKELKAFGGLIPSRENRQALGILFPSSLFSNRAPEKGAILSIFLGGMRKTDFIDKTEDELTKIAISEIFETLETNKKPDFIKIYKYRKAIPQYEITSGERFEAIEAIENNYPGLILAGNIRNGIGIPDRIKQARQIADEIVARPVAENVAV